MTHKSKRILYIDLVTMILATLLISVSTTNVNAASTITIVSKKIGINNLNAIVSNTLSFVLSISGGIALFMLILGGIKYMTANGNEQKTSGAKKTLTWAIFGLILVLLAYEISSIMYDIFF